MSTKTYVINGIIINDISMPRYVEGNRLTADDLTQEDLAAGKRLMNVSRANGYGIAEGLEVSLDADKKEQLNVTGGLGVAADGGLIYLIDPAHLDLKLAKVLVAAQGQAASAVQAALPQADFGDCGPVTEPAPTDPKEKLETGAYVLVANAAVCLSKPSSQRTNRNPRTRDGVRFKLIRLPESAQPTKAPVEALDERYRNRLAYSFFGDTQQVTDLLMPFSLKPPQSVPEKVVWVAWDLPLAVIYWDADKSQVMFVDDWSVRRRMTQCDPALLWAPFVADRRAADGEARFLQFEERMAALKTVLENKPKASDYFRWIPSAAYLPVHVPESRVVLAVLWRHIQLALDSDALINLFGREVMSLLEQVCMRLNTLQEKVVVYANTKGLLDPHTFFTGHVVIDLPGIVDTGLHVLHRSWYDPPLDTARHDPIVIYYILDSFLGLYCQLLDGLATKTITDNGIPKEVIEALALVWASTANTKPTPDLSLRDYLFKQFSLTAERAAERIPVAMYVRAEPDHYPAPTTNPNGGNGEPTPPSPIGLLKRAPRPRQAARKP